MSDKKAFLSTDNFIANSFLGTKTGLLRANRFWVEVKPPGGINFGETNMSTVMLSWNAFMVNVPNIKMGINSVNINTVARHSYKSREDNDLGITFLEDPDLTVRKFFDRWIKQGYDINSLRRGFPDELKGEIRVYPIHQDGSVTSGDVFYEVIPIEIGSMDLSFFNEDVLIRTAITFKFKWHDMGTEKYINSNAYSKI